ncbi:cleavage stimulation factor subunit 2 isoform X7 [Pseudonaja textilis]|uniref:cleavage stimulation factor subunit 2 isoform X7 n=1 Tax=Pseudonaja textilis TaxID=8673 RepID=UPI000EA93252|nr:cleavage stimulation factor subunit 2 isoform X7 [Pseudonaja textilis]
MRPKRGFGRGGGRAPSERARLNMAPTGAPKMAAPEAQGVSGEDGGVPAKVPRRGGQGPSGPRAAVRGAAGRMRGTAFSNRKAPKAEEKGPSGRPGTEDKKEAAGRPAKGQGSPPGGGAAASGGPFEKQPLEVRHEAKPSPGSQAWPQGGAKEQQASLPLQTKLGEAFPKALPAAGGGGGGGGAAGKAPPKGSSSSKPAPEATFTPTAAGLRPKEDQDPEMSEQLKTLISQAIAQGIATGLQQQGGGPAAATSLPPAPRPSQAPPVKKKDSLPGDGDPKDKGVAPNVSPFATLFCPSVFKTLLQKAKITANLGADSAAASGSALGLAGTSGGSAIESDEIPSTKLFLDVVQREWTLPGVGPITTCHEKKFYNVDQELSQALQPPAVDAPVAALMASTVLPADPADDLKGEDKKAETTHRRTHQAAAWAIKAANAASFFNRTTLLWLHQMQARVPPDDVRTHQDLNKLIVAAEFSADATLNTIKFASRAIAASVIARRLLWLRPWVAATRNKWKLAVAPFKGSKLFGDALDPFLVETKDGRKFLPSMHKRPKPYPPPLFPKHSSFQPTDVELEPTQPQRAYFSRWDRQPDRQLDRHPDPDRYPDRHPDLDRQPDRRPDRQLDRLLDLDIQTDRHPDRQLDRHPDRYPDRHPDPDRHGFRTREYYQVPMPDPRAPMHRGPMPASGPPPRGLLGDAPNDPRGGTLLSVTGDVEPRGYLGPPHQGPPMHHMPTHDSRGLPPHEMRGGPMGEPRPLMGEPRGPLMDGRGGRDPRGMEPRVMDGRGMEPRGMEPRGMEPRGMEPRGMEPRGMDGRGMEPRGMEPRGMEPRGMEPRGMEPRGMDGRGMEPRGMDGRGMEPPRGMDTRGMEPPRGMESRGPGMEPRGPGPNPRGPMTGPGPLNMGATGPQGSRQVPSMQGGAMGGGAVQSAAQPGGFSPGQNQVTPQDHEKAALIMQVLQLTADQIAMLPPEQRQSILILKEQIQKSTGAP